MQTSTLLGPLHQIADVPRTTDVDIGEVRQKIDGLGGDAKQVADGLDVARRPKLPGTLGGHAEAAALREANEDLFKIKFSQYR